MEINPLAQFRPRSRTTLLGGDGNQQIENISGAPENRVSAMGDPESPVPSVVKSNSTAGMESDRTGDGLAKPQDGDDLAKLEASMQATAAAKAAAQGTKKRPASAASTVLKKPAGPRIYREPASDHFGMATLECMAMKKSRGSFTSVVRDGTKARLMKEHPSMGAVEADQIIKEAYAVAADVWDKNNVK